MKKSLTSYLSIASISAISVGSYIGYDKYNNLSGPKTSSIEKVVENCKHLPYGKIGNPDKIICREGYAVGYDNNTKNPTWVSYLITEESVKLEQKRIDKFQEDKDIFEDYRSTPDDYFKTGYDRGHMAPYSTVDFSKKSAAESFLMSNIVPQLPSLNRYGWKEIEKYIREWTQGRGFIYVISGVIYSEINTIGNQVAIPSSFYKVLIDDQNNMIAFLVPHRKVLKRDIESYIISVDLLENITGFDFFAPIPDDVEAAKERIKPDIWSKINN